MVASHDVEWPDRRLPNEGDPVQKCRHGKLTSCSVNFDDNPEVRNIYTNDWGNSFSSRNLWKACYSDRDRSRTHDPKAKSPGMTGDRGCAEGGKMGEMAPKKGTCGQKSPSFPI